MKKYTRNITETIYAEQFFVSELEKWQSLNPIFDENTKGYWIQRGTRIGSKDADQFLIFNGDFLLFNDMHQVTGRMDRRYFLAHYTAE